MILFLASLGILVASGALSLVAGRRAGLAAALGVGGAVLGCGVGLVPAARVLAGPGEPSLRAPWQVPYGELHLAIDPLTAFFLLPIFGLSLIAAVYGWRYLRPCRQHRSLGPVLGWFNLLVASMALVTAARNAILFLVAWEAMSLASFFLVTFEDEHEEVRRAGWTYLIATHLGTAFLLALFALLGRAAGGSLDFDGFRALGGLAPGGLTPGTAGMLFVLALVGFGTKAGFLPLHVWLPEAHPAAPSHVSALMSGVMIKLGIYGILRVLTFLGPPPPWWGATLVAIGLVSGVMGVVYALAQHDLKRLLAYHSVENIGIIAIGMGIGMLGVSMGNPLMGALGFGGALLHVLNHALFKGLLFLGAGAVAQATGTREIDRLGGLLRPMPWTGAAFLVGSAAISGLPPLNGFVSEWLIFSGSMQGILHSPGWGSTSAAAAMTGLALIGGLAAACFAKVYGVVFLGEPRSVPPAGAREAGPAMVVPMAALALGCLCVGAWPLGALRLVAPALSAVTGTGPGAGQAALAPARAGLAIIGAAALLLLSLTGILSIARRALLSGREIRRAPTWGCGFTAPTARMQYTGSSFAMPLVGLFRGVIGLRTDESPPRGYFPAAARLSTHAPDAARARLFEPLFARVVSGLEVLRFLQQGRVQLYLLYIVLTLIALLLWGIGF